MSGSDKNVKCMRTSKHYTLGSNDSVWKQRKSVPVVCFIFVVVLTFSDNLSQVELVVPQQLYAVIF